MAVSRPARLAMFCPTARSILCERFGLSAPKIPFTSIPHYSQLEIMNSFIPPFTVHSKPILPFDLSVRHLPFEEMQSLPSSQTHHHHPELYRPPSPGSLNIVPGTSLNSQHHTHGYDTTWQDDSNPGSGYYPVSSATQPAPISTHQPCQPHIAKSSPSNPARDSILRQGPRQRTAHACEKCRDRKTKVSTSPLFDVEITHADFCRSALVNAPFACVAPHEA